MAINQPLQALQTFYHLWLVIEVFKTKQTNLIENRVNKFYCRTKHCDRVSPTVDHRRIQNIDLIPKSIAISGL
ncbi:MAG: hypothetical protein V7K69_30365 [Nostoc sp.]